MRGTKRRHGGKGRGPARLVPLAALQAGRVAARDGALGATPAMGWNTWCTGSPCGQNGTRPHGDKLHDVCHEYEVKQIAAAMQANGMQAAGY
eukprot:gene69-22387_t